MSKPHQYLCYAMLDGCEMYVLPKHVSFLKSQGYHRYACFNCREILAKQVKHCVVPGHKQGYMHMPRESAKDLVKGINNKGGLIK